MSDIDMETFASNLAGSIVFGKGDPGIACTSFDPESSK
jgi:hypothetical protein